MQSSCEAGFYGLQRKFAGRYHSGFSLSMRANHEFTKSTQTNCCLMDSCPFGVDWFMKAQFPEEQTKSGEFQRQPDAFRQWISVDGSTTYPSAADRYHLYVSLACPWASRTVIFRKLKGLEEAIGMTVVDPIRDEKGWAFRDPSGRTPPGARATPDIRWSGHRPTQSRCKGRTGNSTHQATSQKLPLHGQSPLLRKIARPPPQHP